MPECRTEEIGDEFITFRDVIDLTPTLRPEQVMIRIPSGIFNPGNGNSKTHIGEFEISKYAVSNVEYAEFMDHYWNRTWEYDLEDALLPAVNVSFEHAKAFCHWLSSEGDYVYSLPTYLQWEWAARGTCEDRRYPWGNEYNLFRCNSLESGFGRRVKVCDLPLGKSNDGVFNMCGNVSEWVDYRDIPTTMGGNYRYECKHFGLTYQRIQFPLNGHELVGFRYIRRKKIKRLKET